MTHSEKINLPPLLTKATIRKNKATIEISFNDEKDATQLQQILWSIRATEFVENHNTF